MALLVYNSKNCSNVDDVSKQSEDDDQPIDLSCHNRNAVSSRRNYCSATVEELAPFDATKQRKSVRSSSNKEEECLDSHLEVCNKKRSQSMGSSGLIYQKKRVSSKSFEAETMTKVRRFYKNTAAQQSSSSSSLNWPVYVNSDDFGEHDVTGLDESTSGQTNIVSSQREVQSHEIALKKQQELAALYTQLRSNLSRETTSSPTPLSLHSTNCNIALLKLLTSGQGTSDDTSEPISRSPEPKFYPGSSFKALPTPFLSSYNPYFFAELTSQVDLPKGERLSISSNTEKISAPRIKDEVKRKSLPGVYRTMKLKDQQQEPVLPNVFPRFSRANGSESNVFQRPATSSKIKADNQLSGTFQSFLSKKQTGADANDDEILPRDVMKFTEAQKNRFLCGTTTTHARPIRFKPCKFVCSVCGRTYVSEGSLSKHMQSHEKPESENTFKCKICGKTCSTLGALRMHIRTHTLPCECHFCGKAFSRTWLLQGHIRTHTGEKPYQCSKCCRAFADRSNLRAHMQTHEAIKRYSCQNCDKTFSRISLLKRHQRHCGLPTVEKSQEPFVEK